VSVLLVLLFHAGLPFVPAGYLGVSVFFTLSGYLITSLLLVEHARSGTVRVGAFYGRRVKRLLPASTLCLVGVVVARQFGAFSEVTDLRGDVVGAALQVFNWVQLAGGGSYGDLFGSATSPLEHYWSLAIEEQFYWVWPVVVLFVVRRVRRRADGVDRPAAQSARWMRRRLIVAVAILTLLASIAAPLIAQLAGPDAAYWATPARLAEILMGALLATVLHRRWVPANAGRLALPSFAGLLLASMLLPSDHGPAYEGWLPLFAVLSALLVYSLQAPGPVRRLLSTPLLVSTGAISYGLYLFHWPVFVLLRERGWNLTSPPHLVGALAITVTVSLVSYRLVERPVRRTSWRPVPTLRLAAIASVVVLASAVLVAPSGPAISADDDLLDAAAIAPDDGEALVPLVAASSEPAPTTATSEPGRAVSAGPVPSDAAIRSEPESSASTTTTVPTTLRLPPEPPRPVRVLVVGDSTALYVAHGLAAWTMSYPDHAQVSVSWCQGCTFVPDAEITSFDLDGVEDNSRRTLTEVMPDAIRQLRPDVVVLMSTVSDAANRQWDPAEGPIGPTDPRARERMVTAFADLTMEIVTSGVPDVVWVVPPTPTHDWDDDPEMNELARYAAHHEIVREAAARFEHHVSLVDLDAWARETGRFDDPGFRADGVHIDEGPATEMAEQFLGPWLVIEALRPDR
jgi:peptidoglycan/LPS O-acetylase OafA/YrhL